MADVSREPPILRTHARACPHVLPLEAAREAWAHFWRRLPNSKIVLSLGSFARLEARDALGQTDRAPARAGFAELRAPPSPANWIAGRAPPRTTKVGSRPRPASAPQLRTPGLTPPRRPDAPTPKSFRRPLALASTPFRAPSPSPPETRPCPSAKPTPSNHHCH